MLGLELPRVVGGIRRAASRAQSASSSAITSNICISRSTVTLGDRHAAVRPLFDQTDRGELTERLAHRRAREAERSASDCSSRRTPGTDAARRRFRRKARASRLARVSAGFVASPPGPPQSRGEADMRGDDAPALGKAHPGLALRAAPPRRPGGTAPGVLGGAWIRPGRRRARRPAHVARHLRTPAIASQPRRGSAVEPPLRAAARGRARRTRSAPPRRSPLAPRRRLRRRARFSPTASG